MKKIFLLIITVVMLCVQTYGQTWNIGHGGCYSCAATSKVTATLDNGTLTISGIGAMKDYGSEPWKINSINYSSQITHVVIEEGVTTIGDYAFFNLNNLVSIEIPEGITSIGSDAFRSCTSLASIDIPESVKYIKFAAFRYCSSLSSIVIPEGLINIEFNVFSNCTGLLSVSIPASVKDIGAAFAGCTSLISIDVASENTNYLSENGILFNKHKTSLIYYPGGKTGGYIIPDNITTIEASAFSGCAGLISIEIPNSVTNIGTSAFANCTGLSTAIIPKSVTKTADDMFFGCTNLKELTLPFVGSTNTDQYTLTSAIGAQSSVPALKKITITEPCTVLKERTFYGFTSLTEINLPNTLTTIDKWAFEGCTGITSITIPESVKTIGYEAFLNCSNLVEISIPEGITSFAQGVLDGTAWYENQPDGITYIGNLLYNYKGIMPSNTAIDIPEGVVYIVGSAFGTCADNIISVSLPNSLKYIGENAFANKRNIAASITIPENVKRIEQQVFMNCINLTEVNFNAENCTIVQGGLGDYIRVVNIGNNVKTIPEEFLYNVKSIASVTIPEGVTRIGNSAFRGSNITSMVLPEGVTSIGNHSFSDCSKLATITLPSTLTTFGSYALRALNMKVIINNRPTPVAHDIAAYINAKNCTLYVPSDSKSSYQNSAHWESFNIIELPNMSENNIIVTHSDNNTNISWSQFGDIEGYLLTIFNDETLEDIFQVFEFNAEGDLLNPDVNGAKGLFQTTGVTDSFSHTIENLQSGTDYYYTLEVLGVNSVVLATFIDKFTTTSEGGTVGVVDTWRVASLPEVVGFYNIIGQKLTQEPTSGVYIIVYDNGTTEKVIK
jgi:hypothetical protein